MSASRQDVALVGRALINQILAKPKDEKNWCIASPKVKAKAARLARGKYQLGLVRGSVRWSSRTRHPRFKGLADSLVKTLIAHGFNVDIVNGHRNTKLLHIYLVDAPNSVGSFNGKSYINPASDDLVDGDSLNWLFTDWDGLNVSYRRGA